MYVFVDMRGEWEGTLCAPVRILSTKSSHLPDYSHGEISFNDGNFLSIDLCLRILTYVYHIHLVRKCYVRFLPSFMIIIPEIKTTSFFMNKYFFLLNDSPLAATH